MTAHGRWLQVQTPQGWLLLNLGMGGEILLVDRGHLPTKYRLLFDLDQGATLTVNFWWFGHAHFAADLADHPMVGKLGPDALDLTLEEFRALLKGRRGAIWCLEARAAGQHTALRPDREWYGMPNQGREANQDSQPGA